MKPNRGWIDNWKMRVVDASAYTDISNLGYVIEGVPIGHPIFNKSPWIRTSLVVKFDKEKMQIETLNSIYDLGKPVDE